MIRGSWKCSFQIIRQFLNLRRLCKGLMLKLFGMYMKWYSYGGHLEKSVIETKLLEVRYDNKEEELFEAI